MPNQPNMSPSYAQSHAQTNAQTATMDTTVDTTMDISMQLVQSIVQSAEERKGADITVLKVAEVSTLADYFVIVTGFSKVQVRAIARSIEDEVNDQIHVTPRRLEGLSDGTWVLADYGDVIVHVQLPEEREFYNLEAFWGHAERLSVASLVGPTLAPAS